MANMNAKAMKGFDIEAGEKSPFRTVLKLAWPIFLEQLLHTLVNYADTAMVGSMGAVATASVSISNSIVMLINGLAMSMGVGITALVARSIGAKEYDLAKKLIRHTVLLLLYVGLPVGVLLFALSGVIPVWMGAEPDVLKYATVYNRIVAIGRPFSMASMLFCAVYRGCGDMRTPMVINTGVNVLNVIGNYFLINPTRTITLFGASIVMPGAGLGVAGAAISTAVSMALGGLAATLLLFVRQSPFQISVKDDYHIDWPLLRRAMRISVPAMMERLCMSGAQVVISTSIASLGTVTIAANTVYLAAESIAYMPGSAFSSAITTLVGQSLGAGKPKLAERFTYTGLVGTIIIMTIAGAGLFFFAEFLVGIFTPDQLVIALAVRCLRVVAFLEPPQSGAQVFAGALQGAGDTLWILIITMAGMWGIRALGAFVCLRILKLELPYACACMLLESFVRMLLFYLRFRTGKWKTVISDIEAKQKTTLAEANN